MWGWRKQQQEEVLSLSVQPGALLEFQIWWLGCEVELLNGNLLWILRKRWRHVLHCIRGGGKLFFRCKLRYSWPVHKRWEDFKVLSFDSRLSCETSDWTTYGRAAPFSRAKFHLASTELCLCASPSDLVLCTLNVWVCPLQQEQFVQYKSTKHT